MGRYLFFAVIGASSFANGMAEERPQRDALPEGLAVTAPHIPDQVTGVLRTLNEQLCRDLDPADNAAVLLLQTVGSDALDPGVRENTLAMLGIQKLSPTTPRFLYFVNFVQSLPEISLKDVPGQVALLDVQLNVAGERPWTREQFPVLFAYLRDNQSALNLVVDASQKLRYYAPLLSEEAPPRLISGSFAMERRLPFLAKCLAARAMLNASEDRLEAAILDLSAGHRWAKLLADGSPLDVSAAKAHIIDATLSQAATALLENGLLTGESARLYLRELKTMGPLPRSAEQATVGERAILHQEMELLQADETALQEFFELPNQKDPPTGKRPLPEIDWARALQSADHIQDRFVRALQTGDRAAQGALFDELDRDYEAWKASDDAMIRKFADPAHQEVKAVSRWIGETMAWSLRPWYRQRRMSDDRAQVRRDLITIGLGLTVFRSEHGEFPASLSELAPNDLPEVPTDAQTDRSFTYLRVKPDHARLTSWGANQTEDAGGSYSDDHILNVR